MTKSKKKKVFHVITHLDMGGAVTVAVNIASSNNKEFEYHIVEVSQGKSQFSDELLKYIEKKGIVFHRSLSSVGKLNILLFPLRFLYIYIKERPAVIHSHAEGANISVYLFYILFGWMFRKTKYVRTIHNTMHWNKWERLGRIVEPFFIHHHCNVSISYAVQKSYSDLYGDPGPIIFNGIEEVEQRAFDGIDKTKINVLFAGRFEYQKGVSELIQVVKRTTADMKIDFWIIGEGSYYQTIKENCYGLKNVHINNKIFGLSSFLSSFDFLFMPSNFEGLALMPIEASLAGVPTIINSCPGLSETLPKDWPLKVNNNDIEEFMAIFNHLGSYDRKKLGSIAYNYAKENFSIEKMQKEYEKFYMS